MSPRPRVAAMVLGLAAAAGLAAADASARTLEEIEARGRVSICAHPNALPFSKRRGERHGINVEIGKAVADRLGVGFEVRWITSRYHPGRVNCDLIVGSIGLREVQSDRGIKLTRAYHRTGVGLAVRDGDGAPPSGFGDLHDGQRVGVLVGSLAHREIAQRGLARTIPFGFEEDMLQALVSGEIDAAALSAEAVEFHNANSPGAPLGFVHAYDDTPDLAWPVAIGVRRSKFPLLQRLNELIDEMLRDGSFADIYARYGLSHRTP